MVSARLVGLKRLMAIAHWLLATAVVSGDSLAQERPRARDLGIVVGSLPTGGHNAITDVPGVMVGHRTVTSGDSINTGVTAILPHSGNVFRDRVPAAVHVINGFGKLVGSVQVRELGELETPVLLTCTLCVWRAADALADHLLAAPGMQSVRSINVVVGETNDGTLNDIRLRAITAADVRAALDSARSGPVGEGSIGAGHGTTALGWKGGIGTSSRVVAIEGSASFTLGVLVQSNFGGALTITGVPVGAELARRGSAHYSAGEGTQRGSIMIVLATDAPLSASNLERLAKRTEIGLARTGSSGSSGSGDFVVAFSTAESVRRRGSDRTVRAADLDLSGDALNRFFQAAADATEEAIYNSMLRATPVRYRGRTVEPIPLAETIAILDRHGARRTPRPE